jgi:hypothetical protein
MRTVETYFDGFYLRRELNRRPEEIDRMKRWCDETGHRLYFLANSGCVADCAMHVFHDNLVAHEKDIAAMRNVNGFEPLTCKKYLSVHQNRHAFLQGSWIRPEDVHHYEGLVSGMKLATRTHAHPGHVISAYARGKFSGNLLDLCEPGYGEIYSPYVIDNTRMPEDFFERVTACDKQCHMCNYCRKVYEDAIVKF